VTLDNAENKAFVDAYQKEYNLLPDVFGKPQERAA